MNIPFRKKYLLNVLGTISLVVEDLITKYDLSKILIPSCLFKLIFPLAIFSELSAELSSPDVEGVYEAQVCKCNTYSALYALIILLRNVL